MQKNTINYIDGKFWQRRLCMIDTYLGIWNKIHLHSQSILGLMLLKLPEMISIDTSRYLKSKKAVS